MAGRVDDAGITGTLSADRRPILTLWSGSRTAALGLGTFDRVDSVMLPSAVDDDLASVCGLQPSWLCETVYDATNGNRFLTEFADWSVAVLIILFSAWILTVIARRYLGHVVARVVAPDKTLPARHLKRLGDRAPAMVPDALASLDQPPDPRRAARIQSISAVVGSTASVIIWVIARIMVLGQLGVGLAPLIAGAGIAGVALGFGAQSLVKDCIAGLFMLLEDQYGIGDVVDLDEAIGTVEKISLRTTVLRGVDGTVWHVPNGEVQRVGNRSQLWSVAVVDVDVAYDCDLAAARDVILDCVETVCAGEDWAAMVLEPPQMLGVEVLGADGITIRVTVKTEPGAQWGLQRAIREALKGALDGAGIEIPFPQRTIWVRRDDSGASVEDHIDAES
jgi:small conductance mechanosensitive channel